MTRAKRCPACPQHLLEAIEARGSSADLCPRCGGLWFEAGSLSRAIRAHDPDALPPRPVAESVGKQLGASKDRCPNCEEKLESYQLSDANPVRVDVCCVCSGAWLPHGNLDQVLAGHQLPEAQLLIGADRSWANWFLQFLTGLPTEFNVQPRRTPGVTYALVLLNGLIHFAGPLILFFPAIGTVALALEPSRIGELSWFASLLTSQFLHVDTLHLLANMYFLWILGDNVEDVLGHRSFLLFYLLAGTAGGILFSLFADPEIPAVGASGAISGVFALYAVLFRRAKLTFMLIFWQFKLAAPAYLGTWVALNLAGWVFDVPGIAWEDHLGGFAFGLGVGLASHRRLLRRRPLLRLINSGASHAA